MTAHVVPADVYLDTSVFVAAMIAGDPHSPTCIQFCADLAANGSIIYFSELVRLEVAHVVRSIATRGAAPQSLEQQFQLSRFNSDLLVRQRWMQFGMAQLDALLATFFVTYELLLRKRIQRQSVLLISLYNLNSYDAVHVATALRHGVPDLAAVDGHFARVSGLRVHIIR